MLSKVASLHSRPCNWMCKIRIWLIIICCRMNCRCTTNAWTSYAVQGRKTITSNLRRGMRWRRMMMVSGLMASWRWLLWLLRMHRRWARAMWKLVCWVRWVRWRIVWCRGRGRVIIWTWAWGWIGDGCRFAVIRRVKRRGTVEVGCVKRVVRGGLSARDIPRNRISTSSSLLGLSLHRCYCCLRRVIRKENFNCMFSPPVASVTGNGVRPGRKIPMGGGGRVDLLTYQLSSS